MENNGGGYRSDVSVDDSDKDPDFVLQDADDESDSRLVIDSTLSSPDSSLYHRSHCYLGNRGNPIAFVCAHFLHERAA
ncbi:Hypothetical protein FKW44_017717 [Caligus rogercresseyi]|uniref:Uncharacterized protein n=1 Tax=Caligus rogercresseyi TaxID=217165 RepID=A0A7T8JWW3_CALRO|nr:Hypothetical protein FKW44_017717 [Caligus rogercresseyi]